MKLFLILACTVLAAPAGPRKPRRKFRRAKNPKPQVGTWVDPKGSHSYQVAFKILIFSLFLSVRLQLGLIQIQNQM